MTACHRTGEHFTTDPGGRATAVGAETATAAKRCSLRSSNLDAAEAESAADRLCLELVSGVST